MGNQILIMGREEKMESTQRVGPFVCWLTWICCMASIWAVYKWPLDERPWWNGFASHMVSTVVIFAFSYTFGNSSLYDPAWYLLPVGVAAGWAFTPESGPSVKGLISFALLCLW